MSRLDQRGFILIVSALLLVGCNSNKKKEGELPYGELIHRASTRPTTPPDTVYVGNFDLGQTVLKNDPGIVNRLTTDRPRLLHLGEPDEPQDPAQRIAYLDDLLAKTLVRDLNSKGIHAQQLRLSDSTPTSGWKVSGALVNIDEGNRMQRTIIGFGAGESEVQLTVTVVDLAYGNQQPFDDLTLNTDSGKMPGAAVTLNPAVAAAKFHMNKNASSKDIKKAAGEIAADIESEIKKLSAKK